MAVFRRNETSPIPSPPPRPDTGGAEWIIDARGCDADPLRDGTRLEAVFDRLIAVLRLTPVAPAVWHTFPAPGGLTGS